MSNPETQLYGVETFDVRREEENPFSLRDVLDTVHEKGLFIHQFTDEQATTVMPLVKPKYYRKVDDQWNITQGFDFDEENQRRIWGTLAPNEAGMNASHMVANYYGPGDFIPKHLDVKSDGLVLVRDGFFESMLTFLYVVEGSKDILLYPEGENTEARTLRQKPGMLLVFPMNDIYDMKGMLIAKGLYHEVPPQHESSVTFTWEIKRRPIQGLAT